MIAGQKGSARSFSPFAFDSWPPPVFIKSRLIVVPLSLFLFERTE
jgi:hypothetical protein